MTDAPHISGLRISREDMSLLIRGAAIDVAPHRHHALQIAIGLAGPFRFECGEAADMYEGIIVAPGAKHRLDSLGRDVAVLLAEPELAASRAARERLPGGASFAPLPAGDAERLRALCRQTELPSPAQVLAHVAPGAPPPRALDPRIAALQEGLRALPEKRATLGELAAELGLSESRLTHLFKQETGVSLRRYLLWLRLSDAMARALSGVSLTEAAHASGFSDSAHLSRTCRDMFGINPQAVARHSRFIQAGNGSGT
ncbi:MAG: helix-turn-helix transcriptional regulator [Parvibaculum sp.]|nr:helix-turn-helix transcriptional regulator [Parvibaculum sp.]